MRTLLFLLFLFSFFLFFHFLFDIYLVLLLLLFVFFFVIKDLLVVHLATGSQRATTTVGNDGGRIETGR